MKFRTVPAFIAIESQEDYEFWMGLIRDACWYASHTHRPDVANEYSKLQESLYKMFNKEVK